MLRVKTSRRKARLKPTDYDHEIDLVDRDAAKTPSETVTPEPNVMVRHSTNSRLLASDDEQEEHTQLHEQEHYVQQDQQNNKQNQTVPTASNAQPNGSTNEHGNQVQTNIFRASNDDTGLDSHARPSIEIQGPISPTLAYIHV